PGATEKEGQSVNASTHVDTVSKLHDTDDGAGHLLPRWSAGLPHQEPLVPELRRNDGRSVRAPLPGKNRSLDRRPPASSPATHAADRSPHATHHLPAGRDRYVQRRPMLCHLADYLADRPASRLQSGER